jgi:predicted DNA-binding transcriptional regulator AlpA
MTPNEPAGEAISICVKAKEAWGLLGLGKTTFYELVKKKILPQPCVRHKKTVLWSRQAILSVANQTTKP